VQDVDPELAIVELDEMTGVLRESLWRQRLAAVLVGLLAALAALIAVGGLYAVISYAVARQTKELGMRVALGATERHIAAGVLGHGLRLTGIGAVLGTLLSILLSRSLESLIPTPDDTAWMALAVAGVLAILTVVACWIPVRRALAVDPVTALRVE
jgi:putative ABC transport system permease protein